MTALKEESQPLGIVGKLTAWQILDIELIAQQGFMRVSSRPRGGTGKLIDMGVLIYEPFSGVGPIVRPTSDFHRVRAALLRRRRRAAA